MDTIEERNLEDAEDCALVRKGYGRLRRVLNRVRMWDGGAATALPGGEGARADLAERLGIEGGLIDYVDRYRSGIAALYEKTYAEARAAADA